jgi:damage-control phosphatase, subfamily I
MGLKCARQALRDEVRVMSFMKAITDLTYFGGKESLVTSADVVKDIWSLLVEVAGDNDPFKAVKKEQNLAVLQVYPLMKERISKSRDPIGEAVRLAIIGNSLDAMRDALGKPPQETLERFSKSTVRQKDLRLFKDRLKRAKKIVYFADNCGEIVSDRLLIEALSENCRAEILLVVRSTPTLNDATLIDARFVGLDKVVPVIENGIKEPLPGTALMKVSPGLRKLIKEADLLIAKGGGNHDSMTEESTIQGKTTYLFQVKCHPYSSLYHLPQNGLIVHNG